MALYTVAVAYGFVITATVFVGIFLIRTLVVLHKVKGKLSRRTHSAQRNVLYSLILQALAPLVLLFVPFVIFAVVAIHQLYDWNHIIVACVFLILLHGVASNLAMIATTPRFRDIVFSFQKSSVKKVSRA
ncbi:unnamed protein product [Caenorhabditis auriculariae]|uniref:G protein-coupled receptor n=1 Tax=Caenorhabditis auriculariae TaxID=2777116 RepID=A0A8S1H5Y7_9PELO|nr:unnamed protein product [Caenorhabditis auriculariae]